MNEIDLLKEEIKKLKSELAARGAVLSALQGQEFPYL